MKEVAFTKMHGIGNDYVYFTEMPCPPENLPELSRRLSDRHRGIGGDGIILALPSEIADFRMRIFNADGSEARMCGNGSRCVGKLVSDLGLTDKDQITLETLSGIKTLRLTKGADGKVTDVCVDMGAGKVSATEILQGYRTVPVDMGNPHGVVFIDCSPDDFDVKGLGSRLENDPFWPDRANIEFAHVASPDRIDIRVWERGSGETMACGTGACATALAAFTTGRCSSKVTIGLPGGELIIEIQPGNRVIMTGPAETCYTGTVLI